MTPFGKENLCPDAPQEIPFRGGDADGWMRFTIPLFENTLSSISSSGCFPGRTLPVRRNQVE